MAYYHCLLFDLDGTLLDFGAAEDAAIRETLAYYGFERPQEAVEAYKQINSALWGRTGARRGASGKTGGAAL